MYIHVGYLVCSGQPQFSMGGLPAGHMTQYGYATYQLVPVPPQEGIIGQPHATVTAPAMPFGGKNDIQCTV